MKNAKVEEPGLDWTATTWEGSRREQLRRARQLTLRERLQAVEDMTKVAMRLRDAGRKAKSLRRK